MNQKTIKESVSLSGIGLHTGDEVTITFKPAAVNTGFTFVRVDLENQPKVKADVAFVQSTTRSTNLVKDGVSVNTTEHVLAALEGCGIDNVIVELDNSELPILDGSSRFFVEAIEKAGIEEQDKEREVFVVKDIISYKDEESGSEILLLPSDEYQVSVMVDYNSKVLGSQNASLNSLSEFKDNIANARTFVFLHELEALLDNGLIKGGDLNNAIVYVDQEIKPETIKKLEEAFEKDSINVKPNGILDNLTLHYTNEAARHKLLDVIGDVALVGTKIQGKIIATKPGHGTNTEFAKKLAGIIKKEQRNPTFEFDITQPAVMDIHQIMDMLPHRPPFLLIDKILELGDERVVGMKNVTMNEEFFVGHFPGAPVMPGVLIIEAMAQTGGILVLSTVPDPENYLTIFMKIDKVKFKNKVLPGDTLVFDCNLMTPIRRGICHMSAKAYVNGKLVTEAELMAQIVRKN